MEIPENDSFVRGLVEGVIPGVNLFQVYYYAICMLSSDHELRERTKNSSTGFAVGLLAEALLIYSLSQNLFA